MELFQKALSLAGEVIEMSTDDAITGTLGERGADVEKPSGSAGNVTASGGSGGLSDLVERQGGLPEQPAGVE